MVTLCYQLIIFLYVVETMRKNRERETQVKEKILQQMFTVHHHHFSSRVFFLIPFKSRVTFLGDIVTACLIPLSTFMLFVSVFSLNIDVTFCICFYEF